MVISSPQLCDVSAQQGWGLYIPLLPSRFTWSPPMPRIRSIKPEFWTDEKVVQLSSWGRLLFIGLWNLADDDGRMEWSPTRVKMQLFPADKVDVIREVKAIEALGMVCLYDVEGRWYLQVMNFSKHQKIDKRYPSKLPVPPIPADSPRIPPNAADSPRFPPLEWNGMGSREGMDISSSPDGDGVTSGKASQGYSEGFTAFWNAYPRKIGKGAAWKAWRKAKGIPNIVLLLKAVELQRRSKQWQDAQYIPHPATWINEARWDDEPDAPKREPSRPLYKPDTSTPVKTDLGASLLSILNRTKPVPQTPAAEVQ